MRILAGTSGFSYKEWKGPFYPERLPAAQMLEFYASRLPAVEINNTFYRLPSPALLEGWRAQVPPSFRFALKAPRRISHVKRLRGCEEDLRYFLGVADALGASLACVLVQLPPFMKADPGLLAAFTELLPNGTKAAFEFRNASWFTDGAYETLAARNLALVVSQSDERSRVDLPWTADWAYLRLRKPDYDERELTAWLERLRAAPLVEAHVFFKHEDEARGPKLAERFLALAAERRHASAEPPAAT
ncbi:MAG TPA: DUF72 domain-containing protein [Gammaproteobacteria bacterium]